MNPNPIRYTRTAMTLHWLIAFAVLAQIAFGWYLQLVPRETPTARFSSISTSPPDS